MNKTYENFSIKSLDKSRIEITASLPVAIFGSYRAAALKNLNESVTIDGFRKGKVPEATLVQKIGEMTVLEEMAEFPQSRMPTLLSSLMRRSMPLAAPRSRSPSSPLTTPLLLHDHNGCGSETRIA